MKTILNLWHLTDPDCLQCIRRLNDYEYEMIQFVKLDATEEEIKQDPCIYVVVKNSVNLKDKTEIDVCEILSTYGQEFMPFLLEYGDSAMDILAEYFMEDDSLFNENIIAEFPTEKEATDFIEKYVEG